MIRHFSTRTKIIGIILLTVLGMGITATILLLMNRAELIKVPESVSSKTLFPIYVPSDLPGSYKVVAESFSTDEGVLLFSVKDDSGSTVTFTEQSTPASFDFTGFYSQHMRDAKKIEGASYQSVLGRATDPGTDGLILSIRADETWVMATTKTANEKDMEFIAKHFRKMDKE